MESKKKNPDPIFHVTYQVQSHPQGIKRSELQDTESACDAIVMLPITFPENGSFSMLVRSRDGRPNVDGGVGPVPVGDLWRAWATLGAFIKDDPGLSVGQRRIARIVYDALVAAKPTAKA